MLKADAEVLVNTVNCVGFRGKGIALEVKKAHVLELLSSAHWLAVHASPPAEDKHEAVEGIAAWNDRKRQMFRPEHTRLAWDRLAAEGWLWE